MHRTSPTRPATRPLLRPILAAIVLGTSTLSLAAASTAPVAQATTAERDYAVPAGPLGATLNRTHAKPA